MDIQKHSAQELIQKRKRLRRELLETGNLRDIRIAVLGGTTTNEVVDLWELLDVAGAIEFLLSSRAAHITGVEIPVAGGTVF